MRKQLSIFLLKYFYLRLSVLIKTANFMAKKEVGRPKGPKKSALNLSILTERKKRLQKLAIDKDKSVSQIVEDALIDVHNI